VTERGGETKEKGRSYEGAVALVLSG